MKKAICLAACLLLFYVILCMPIIAGQPQKLPSPLFNQTRIGFGFSGEYLNAEARLKVQPSPGLLESEIDISTKQSQTGKRFQVAPCIEFGSTFKNNYYVGLLVSWRYSGLKSNTRSAIESVQYFEHDFTLKYYTDIFMKAGYKVVPRAMVYGLIGPSFTNWTHTSTQFQNNQGVVNNFRINKTAVGLGIGIGAEYYIHKNYALSIDYTHHFHRSASKAQLMSYKIQSFPGLIETYSGDLTRKINLSYATIAVRFTAFFQI